MCHVDKQNRREHSQQQARKSIAYSRQEDRTRMTGSGKETAKILVQERSQISTRMLEKVSDTTHTDG